MATIPIDIRTGTIKKERIIGIDLGTTNSLVAYMHDDHPAIISNKYSKERIVPSVVYFEEDFTPIVGSSANEFLTRFPDRTIYSIKRLMGKAFADVKEELAQFPYQINENSSNSVCKIIVKSGTQSKEFTPIEISSLILKELKRWADDYFEEPVMKAVITVPAYFNDAQRQATKDAGKLAGLEVLRIVNEPTAASLAYGLDKTKNGTIAVYDLGGGTFDISILKLEDGIFEVLSTNGDTHLGGDDIDQALMNHLAQEIKSQCGLDIYTNPQIKQRLRLECEKAKRILSHEPETHIHFDICGQDFSRLLSRSEFDLVISSIIERTKLPCLKALKDAGLTPAEIDAVVLVGGSTRTPFVKTFVSKLFGGKKPYDDINPDEVVALGAAIQAGVLSGDTEDILLLDITPLSLGIETVGGVFTPIIPRNSKVPMKVAQEFTTSVDNQTGIDIHILQGERELSVDNRSLARFTLKPIPPLPAGMPRILVIFGLDANGILTVSAKDQRTGKEQTLEVKPTYGLSDEEVENMLLAGFENAQEDIERRLLIETQVEANALITASQKSIEHQNEIFLSLPTDEQQRINEVLSELRAVVKGDDRKLIAEITEKLNEVTMHFAEETMNKAVQRALENRKVDEIA